VTLNFSAVTEKTGVPIQKDANATLHFSAVHTWDTTGVAIQNTANATPKITAASKTTVQTTQIVVAIVHSAAAVMIHGRATHCAENATHLKNAAQVKPGLLTKITANAFPQKPAALMISILRMICAVKAFMTVVQEICGPQTNFANAIQTSIAAQAKQTARTIFAKTPNAVMMITGQTTSTVFAVHPTNAAPAMFGQITSCANANPMLTAAQAKLGMRIKSALVIQLFLAAQAMFGKLTKTVLATPTLIAAHRIVIQVTIFAHATQLITAAMVTFGKTTRNANANQVLTVAQAIFGPSTRTALANLNTHAVQDKHGEKIL